MANDNAPAICVEQCGNCKFAVPVKEDIRKRICHGTPPQIVPILTPGNVQLTMHFPMVEITSPICSLYKPKNFLTLS